MNTDFILSRGNVVSHLHWTGVCVWGGAFFQLFVIYLPSKNA